MELPKNKKNIFTVSGLSIEKLLLIIMLVVGFTFLGLFAISTFTHQHFSQLSQSFISGNLYFKEMPYMTSDYDDTSLFNGKYFWPLGVFPSIILMPFVFIFGSSFRQGYISLPFTIINFLFLSVIFEKINGRKMSSLVLSFAYIFSSAYIMVGSFPFSWYFASVVLSTCMILAVYFTLVNPKPFISGMFFSFAFLTRISASLGVVFFILYYLIFERKIFVKRVIRFAIPVLFGILIFFWYNHARFGNVFETGYRYQINGIPRVMANKDIGMWSIKHIPTNLYLFLLKTPVITHYEDTKLIPSVRPSHWGMSIFITTPIILFLFRSNFNNKLNVVLLISAVSVAVFLFGSYGLGAWQYGYRFALDFQIFLFLIISSVFKDKKMSIFTMLFVYFSFLINLYMVAGFFNPTPESFIL